MSKPASFCTVCTSTCSHELVGLLLSLSLYHPNEKIYIMSDTKTKNTIENITPKPLLDIQWFVELDEYNGLNRFEMEKKGIFGNFLTNKMIIINYALDYNTDTLFIDSDIIITDTINNINIEKDVGLSPQYIKQPYIDNTGFYNAGFFWTKHKHISNNWKLLIDYNNHCPEQINMKELEKYNYFIFEENYNIQAWRMLLSDESPDKIGSYFSLKNNIIFYKNNPLKCIHTHFLDKRFNMFNNLIINILKTKKDYRLLLIIYRVIHNKWILKVPKQPIQGLGYHKNDSYRELPLLMKINNNDVELQFINNSIHCWIEPNVLTYDRPTLEWLNNDCNQSSLLLLGNGSVDNEGKQIIQKIPSTNVKPWIFWPRKPMLVEKILKTNNILSYNERIIESVFIGNIENNVQNIFRNDLSWKNVISEYICTKGTKHIFSHEEYLHKISKAKYGLCLRGYGSKCHREIELMAFGTVPIITPDVCIDSYLDPPIENIHYIRIKNANEYNNIISNISCDEWKKMSNACIDWYNKNVHSKNCWNNMINYLLYET